MLFLLLTLNFDIIGGFVDKFYFRIINGKSFSAVMLGLCIRTVWNSNAKFLLYIRSYEKDAMKVVFFIEKPFRGMSCNFVFSCLKRLEIEFSKYFYNLQYIFLLILILYLNYIINTRCPVILKEKAIQ